MFPSLGKNQLLREWTLGRACLVFDALWLVYLFLIWQVGMSYCLLWWEIWRMDKTIDWKSPEWLMVSDLGKWCCYFFLCIDLYYFLGIPREGEFHFLCRRHPFQEKANVETYGKWHIRHVWSGKVHLYQTKVVSSKEHFFRILFRVDLFSCTLLNLAHCARQSEGPEFSAG